MTAKDEIFRCTETKLNGWINSRCTHIATHDPDEDGVPTKCPTHSTAAIAKRAAKAEKASKTFPTPSDEVVAALEGLQGSASSWELEVARLQARIAELEKAPKVGALEWDGFGTAYAEFGDYHVLDHGLSEYAAYWNDDIIGRFDTEEAAKAACQEHFERSVQACLE